jgi:hypothetical protein
VKLCADDLLCPECEVANANKPAELHTKTKLSTTAAAQEPSAVVAEPTNQSGSSNSKINRPEQKKPEKLSSSDTVMHLTSGVAAKSAAAVNCDVETIAAISRTEQTAIKLSLIAAVSVSEDQQYCSVSGYRWSSRKQTAAINDC